MFAAKFLRRTFASKPKYDVCIIGGGPSGFAAAMRCHDYGKSVCLIEKDRVGGAGLWNGALASKTMWEIAERYIVYRRVALNLTTTRESTSDFTPLHVRRVNEMVNKALNVKYEQMLSQLDGCGVTLVSGAAEFANAGEVVVRDASGAETERISATRFIIATGSRPRPHPTVKIDGEYVITSDHIHSLDRFPSSLVVVGAGVVGCEYASMFAKFKQTKVHLIDRSSRILPFEDADISSRVAMHLKRRDATLHSESSLQSMVVKDGMVEFVVVDNQLGYSKTVRVEKALMSIGRVPNVESLALDKAGVDVDSRGCPIIHDVVGTSAPNIAAVGDVSAEMSLVNVGEIEARYAVHRFFSHKRKQPHFLNSDGEFRAENVSTIFFVDPEVAAAGRNEQSLQADGIAYRASSYDYRLVSRAIAMRKNNGMVKLLVTNDDEMRILGVRAVGPHASSVIEVVSLLLRTGRSVYDLNDLLTSYPSITEGLLEAVRLLLGSSIYKPHVFPNLAKVTEWKPGDPKTAHFFC